MPVVTLFFLHFCLSHRSKFLGEGVIELLHGNPAVTVVIELAHEDMLLVVSHMDVKPSKKDSKIHI